MYNHNEITLSHQYYPMLTFMMAMKWVMSLHLYFISKPFFSRVTFVLYTAWRKLGEFHTIMYNIYIRRVAIDLPLGNIVEVQCELGEHWALLFILLLGPIQHLTHLKV